MTFSLPPLSLYAHIPWCVRKCPYCDFNSHQVRSTIDQAGYIDSLLLDLEQDLPQTLGRPLHSIFIGGGTPSLFTPGMIRKLLEGIGTRLELEDSCEITMEANPGTLERGNFAGYREAGVTRLSIGVQSFDDTTLKSLGRIHDPDEAITACVSARQEGFERINLDLMYGLPSQSLELARSDIQIALELDPGHLSHYQLTLEPNTRFAVDPPHLPDEELLWEIEQQGHVLLRGSGYEQYEISAFSRPGERCRHNLNYWMFGDYLGLGAGAHAKITNAEALIERKWKWKSPEAYQEQAAAGFATQGSRILDINDIRLEFMMNGLRLIEGFEMSLMIKRTGQPIELWSKGINQGIAGGLLINREDRLQPTEQGGRYLNDLLNLFAPDN